jgi:hypothetical protein
MVYTYMLNRWWRATLATGLALLVLAAGLGGLPLLLPQYPFMWADDWKLWLVAGAGGFALVITIILAGIRKSAYVQPFEKHFTVATPFIKFNISYQRIRQTYSSEFQQLFQVKKAKGLRRDRWDPLANKTVLVLELTSLPLPRWVMKMYLSPLFFPDRTSRMALMVPDWMALSTEMDSRCGSYQESLRPVVEQSASASLLAGLKKPPK